MMREQDLRSYLKDLQADNEQLPDDDEHKTLKIYLRGQIFIIKEILRG